jgi:hypothetical protein
MKMTEQEAMEALAITPAEWSGVPQELKECAKKHVGTRVLLNCVHYGKALKAAQRNRGSA